MNDNDHSEKIFDPTVKLKDEILENELSEYQKFMLSQMVNSDAKTIEEIGLMHQKQLSEMLENGRKYLIDSRVIPFRGTFEPGYIQIKEKK